MLKYLPDWFWPVLRKPTTEQQADTDNWFANGHSAIRDGNWKTASAVALEEARRIFDAEVERRKGADGKAAIYLAAITALLPVLVSLLPVIWGDKINKVAGCISILVFMVAVAFLLRAGAAAFTILRVSNFTQVGPADLAKCWTHESPEESLAKELSRAALHNFPLVNVKISGVLLTHEFLLRALLSFSVLMVIQVIWPVASWAVEQMMKLFTPEVAVVLTMCYS